jgi:hypothetical protein
MKTLWTAGIKDEQRKSDIESAFKSATVVRKRLRELCEAKTVSSFNTSKDQYDTPNWTYLQADMVGYHRALKEICSLLGG